MLVTYCAVDPLALASKLTLQFDPSYAIISFLPAPVIVPQLPPLGTSSVMMYLCPETAAGNVPSPGPFAIGLTILSRGDLAPTSSVLDTVEEKTEDTPAIPENNN